MGVVIDSERNQLFSIGNDKKLKVTDLNYQKTHTEIVAGYHPLTCLQYDVESKRLYVTNTAGELFIYSVMDKAAGLVKQMILGSVTALRGLAIDFPRNYVFSCTVQS